jgi:hypothetical protein
MSGSTWGDSWGSCWGDTWGVIDTQAFGAARRPPLPGPKFAPDDGDDVMMIVLAALHIMGSSP